VLQIFALLDSTDGEPMALVDVALPAGWGCNGFRRAFLLKAAGLTAAGGAVVVGGRDAFSSGPDGHGVVPDHEGVGPLLS
jgi:hypothetical protein